MGKLIKNKYGVFSISSRKSSVGFGGMGKSVWQHLVVRNLRTGRTRHIKAGMGFITTDNPTEAKKQFNNIMKYAFKVGDIERFSHAGKCEIVDIGVRKTKTARKKTTKRKNTMTKAKRKSLKYLSEWQKLLKKYHGDMKKARKHYKKKR